MKGVILAGGFGTRLRPLYRASRLVHDGGANKLSLGAAGQPTSVNS